MKPPPAPFLSRSRLPRNGAGQAGKGAGGKFFLNCVNCVNLFILVADRVNERFSRVLAICRQDTTRRAPMAAIKVRGDRTMFRNFRIAAIGTALAAASLLAAAPAQARDRHRHHGGGGDDAAIAIGAGIVGIAIGAAIASDNDDRHDRRYYRDGYYGDYYGGGSYGYVDPYPRGYYYRSYPRYRGHDRDYRYDRRDYRHYRGSYRHRDHYRGEGYRGH
jgi:hypothetical protein